MNFLTLMRSLIVFLICLLLPLIPLTAAEFQKGFEAHLRGDYATAIREWGPLAAQGDSRAQFNIGNMFDFGKGVTEDNAQAYSNNTFLAIGFKGVIRTSLNGKKWTKSKTGTSKGLSGGT